jgi:SagB-type dehydrogenase family enzyme
MASAKEEVHRVVDLLSDFECEQLACALDRTVAGERFWEDDVAILYNEYVKTRSAELSENFGELIPSMAAGDDGLFFPIPIVKAYEDAARVGLPAPDPVMAGVGECLLRRRSRRDYTGESLSATQLSTVLAHACGSTGASAGYGYSRLPLRSFPSAGGLQAPEVYLSVQAVAGVPAGVYHYHPGNHALELLAAGDHGATLSTVAMGQDLQRAAVVFVVTGCYARVRWKYGERAYRYMCMDAGFLGQNLCLVAEAMGLGACAIAGFVDDAADRLLGVDGRDELSVLLVSIGCPATQ